MPLHDFTALLAHYPDLIAQMPENETFSSHQFILYLAQHHQTLYVEALYAYRITTRQGTPAPFMNVHRELSKHLHDYPELVRQVADKAPSTNIFGESIECSEWMRQAVSGA